MSYPHVSKLKPVRIDRPSALVHCACHLGFDGCTYAARTAPAAGGGLEDADAGELVAEIDEPAARVRLTHDGVEVPAFLGVRARRAPVSKPARQAFLNLVAIGYGATASAKVALAELVEPLPMDHAAKPTSERPRPEEMSGTT